MILGTMKPRTAAPILAKIQQVRARRVSKIILNPQLPADFYGPERALNCVIGSVRTGLILRWPRASYCVRKSRQS